LWPADEKKNQKLLNMKIAITVKGNQPDCTFDPRFGRCAYIAVFDTETRETAFYNNAAKEQQSGAGPKMAEILANLGVDKVFSGDFGPKAKNMLETFGIEMVVLKDEPLYQELISKIK
jgi:predicted Fe-Mo cluster-binding NifX family protein